MSCVEIYAFDKDGNSHEYGEARNSHGGAMMIWDHLWVKYRLAQKDSEYYPRTDEHGECPSCGRPGRLSFTGDLQLLWDLFKDSRVTDLDRVLLGFTFDRVWIKKENLSRLIGPLDMFFKIAIESSGYAETLGKVVAHLRRAADDPDVIGVAFNQTSVTGDPYFGQRLVREDPDGFDDEWRPYNLNTDDGHWELFEKIDRQSEATAL